MSTISTAAEVIGRGETLDAIERFLAGPPGRAAVLEGEAGIGKTTVWRAGVERAQALGHLVLEARPVPAEATLALAALVDLVSGVDPSFHAGLPEVQRRALAAALADGADVPADGRVLAAAFRGLVRAAAAERPLLLAVDDLQWLDEASAAVLVYAWRRVGDADVRLIAACRGEPGAPLPFGLGHGVEPASLDRLPLEPLSEGAIRRLLRVRLGIVLSRAEIHALYQAVRGNPLFALELARAGFEVDAAGSARLPQSLHDLVAVRIRALPKSARDALLHVAVLADPRAVVIERAGVRDALEPALLAGVLELDGTRFRFAHPLMGSAAWADAGANVRRAVHRALAGAVATREERVRHLAAAAEPPDADVAALLEEVAEEAVGRGAPAAAADLLDRALALAAPGDAAAWARLAARAAAAHAEAAHWDRVEELVEQAQRQLPPGPARAAIIVSETEFRPGLDDLLRQAVAEAGATQAAVRAAIGLAEQATLALRLDEAIAHAAAAVASARAVGDRGLLGVALTFLGGLKLLDTRLDGEAEIAEAESIERELGGLPVGVYESPRMWRAATALWRDDAHTAADGIRQGLRAAEERGDDMSAFQFRQLLAHAELNAGDWAGARATVLEALEQAESLGYEYGRLVVLGTRALVHADEGDHEQARELGSEAVAGMTAVGDRLWSTYAQAALLRAAVFAGDAASAAAAAAAIGERFPGRECWWSYHQGDEIEALVVAGEQERALDRVGDLRRAAKTLRLPRFLAWADRGESLLHAQAGDLAAAAAGLESALAEHDRFTLPFERARTLLLYGHVLRRQAKRRAAREALADALAEFTRLGAGRHLRAAQAELAHVGGRPPAGVHELTAAEDRIAELVARGLSNKEVAGELFVTVSTVEAALTRVYAKLGLRSRAQLAARRPAG